MRSTHAIVTGCGLLLGACAAPPATPGADTTPPDRLHILHAPPDSLLFRWEVNDATREGISAMRALVAEGADHTGLKAALVNEMALIFERCTMTGEGHEHLHDYLLPLLTMAQALPDAPSTEEVQAIREHLARFEDGFR